jgi:cytidine kinase
VHARHQGGDATRSEAHDGRRIAAADSGSKIDIIRAVVTPALLVLGNLLVDDLVFPDGSTRMGQSGGAVLYAALGARLWNVRTGCVSVRGDDYPAATLDRLQGCGIDLAGVKRLRRPGVRTWLLYEGDVRHLVHRLGCPAHEEVSPVPEDIPPEWRQAPAFHLAPMPFDVQRALLRSIESAAAPFVSVDPHLPIADNTLAAWRDALAGVDAFFPSEHELLFEQAKADPEAALARLVSGRLRFVALKRGEHGGLLYDAHDGRFHSWTARTTRVVDPTGAGDAFAMGFVSAHLAGLAVEDCLHRAVVTASFAIEAWGSDALISATPDNAERRLRSWYGEQVEP